MGKRHRGVLSSLKHQVNRGKGGRKLYEYILILLKDPCVYCGELGCDSIDHIDPLSKGGLNGWENYAPAHKDCNNDKQDGSILQRLLQPTKRIVEQKISNKFKGWRVEG